MSLTTGKRLSRQQWDELPMPDGVIAAVETMAEEQEQPLFEDDTPCFEWSPGVAIEDEDAVPIIVDPEENQGAGNQGANAQGAGATPDNENEDGHDEPDLDDDPENDGTEVEENDNPPPPGDENETPDEDEPVVQTMTEEVEHDDNGETGEGNTPEEDDGDDAEPSEDKQEGPTTGDGNGNIGNTRYSMRPNRTRNYDNRLANQMDNPES
jgi:hypothetical protein